MVAAVVIIGVFVLGWAFGGSGRNVDAAQDLEQPPGSTTTSATHPAGSEPDGDTVEPYSGPTLPLTLNELETRWNQAAEQAESLLTITELTLDLTRERETDDGALLAPFFYTWDNIELFGWAHIQDERLNNILVRAGRLCTFITSEDGELVEQCRGSAPTPEEFLRFLDLHDRLIAVIHPGLDITSITADWVAVPVGRTSSTQSVAADGNAPVINGVWYFIFFADDLYSIHATPSD